MTSVPPRIELRNIQKRFGGVHALRGASLVVAPGSIHALIGENGAGKSTMIKMIAGLESPDSGEILMDGEHVTIASTAEAMRLGVRTVYQEPELVPELTVTENIFLGREMTRGGRISWKEQAGRTEQILDLIDFPKGRAAMPVRRLSIAEQQQVAIAKAVADDARILILDEPSAILTDAEISRLFDIVRRLASSGVAVIYITHRLDEVFKISDAITVLRDGQLVTSVETKEARMRDVIEWMVGDIQTREKATRPTSGEPVLEAKEIGFSEAGPFNDVTVYSGEVVGLYGLLGSGTFELVESLYGMRSTHGGQVHLDGKRSQMSDPRSAKAAGISVVPANRARQALFSFQSIKFNITIRELQRFSSAGFLALQKELKRSKELISALRIKTPSPHQRVSAMSGGNAQKVVMARQMVGSPRLLLLAEPTQGVDVGAKEEIHQLIEKMAEEGSAVLMATTDLTELTRMCDRVLVFREGEIVREFRSGFTQSQLLAAASGVTEEEGASA